MTPEAVSHSAISILGLGHRLPAATEDNEQLCRTLDISPTWIEEKTGIKRRHVAAPEDTLWSYAVDAARGALAMAGVMPEQLDLIVVCTFSGDYLFPPVSAKVQQQLGATNAQIFDLQANCAGFVTGLTVAADRIRGDAEVNHALVIGAEFCTRYVDRRDVNTAVYLSDGAGAAILGRSSAGSGLLASAFHTDTSNFEGVRLRGGGSAFPNDGRPFDAAIDRMEMNGIATWKQAITHLPPTIRKACRKAGIEPGDVDFLVFHQANLRLIEYLVRKMGFSMEKTYCNVAEVGNSGAASLPIALSEGVARGKIKPGNLVVLAGVGAGFNFAVSVWRWTLLTPEAQP